MRGKPSQIFWRRLVALAAVLGAELVVGARSALAWGPGVHMFTGHHVLENLALLAPQVAQLLGRWPAPQKVADHPAQVVLERDHRACEVDRSVLRNAIPNLDAAGLEPEGLRQRQHPDDHDQYQNTTYKLDSLHSSRIVHFEIRIVVPQIVYRPARARGRSPRSRRFESLARPPSLPSGSGRGPCPARPRTPNPVQSFQCAGLFAPAFP